MLKTSDLHWLAGLLEGEGCFRMASCSQAGGRTPEVTLAMTDPDVIERAKALMCSSSRRTYVRAFPNKKTEYRIMASGSRAAGLMMTLYPLLGVRRRAAIADALAMWRAVPLTNSAKRICKRGHSLTDESNIYRFSQVTSSGRTVHCRQCRQCNKARKAVWDRQKRAAFIGPTRPKPGTCGSHDTAAP